ncbi:MAG: type II toxin-antitoxin system HicB family antitoxin [Nostocales cyanobacterium 94392]|nr:type II toxin-antitoxin system HicB family antitoxin [Nostocales cyanobacterium 94392]
MKSLQDYTIVIRPDDNNTFVAYVPAIPGCHAWGQTDYEARAELINVFQMIQEEYAEMVISNANKLNLNHIRPNK